MTQTRDAAATPERGRPERRSPLARLALFYRQVVAELRKVVWPTRRELLTYTAVVIVFVLLVIGYVTVVDLGVGELVELVFG